MAVILNVVDDDELSNRRCVRTSLGQTCALIPYLP